jgi:xylan 1,4-beta-xylosidase
LRSDRQRSAREGALSNNYVAMGVDLIRMHDGGGSNGTGAGDVDGPGASRMVPSLDADPTTEASYNFAPTDSMLQNMHDAGADIYFRAGRSNISGGNTVPPDVAKYGEFVKHIVMHYNGGWSKGFMYGIKYFEIWNEPDFIPFWSGTGDQYHDLYKAIALAIKAADPTVLIGGPANSTYNDKTGTRAGLLKYINDNKLPLDFYSFHKYTNKSQDPMDYARMAQNFRDELDMFGLKNAQIVTSEFESSLQGDVMLGGEAGHAAFWPTR